MLLGSEVAVGIHCREGNLNNRCLNTKILLRGVSEESVPGYTTGHAAKSITQSHHSQSRRLNVFNVQCLKVTATSSATLFWTRGSSSTPL